MIKQRMLVGYSMSSTFVQTTLDYLLMLRENFPFETDFAHVTHGAIIDFDINNYDIIFNNYCARHCFEGYVSPHYNEALKNFRGLKILAVQDEYDRTNTLKAAIKELGFHIVLTCVPQADLEYVYPRSEFPNVEFVTVFTGYVPRSLMERAQTVTPLAERKILVGYRGRDIGGKYGRLAFDKYEIGRRMKDECDRRGVSHDIAMDEESRIYGKAWFDFVESCRSMLGSESGSNVFDFDGSIEEKYKELTKKNMGRRPSYEEFQPYVAKRERQINMGQISPRIFESAALRTPMVLFRGRYSDAVAPDTHYIAVEKDFSNIDEVFRKLADVPALEAMAERAYNDLIASEQHTYAAFCERLIRVINSALEKVSSVQKKSLWSRYTPIDSTNFAARERVLLEYPTQMPLSLDEFREKALRGEKEIYESEVDRLDRGIGAAVEHWDQTLSEILEDSRTDRNSDAIKAAGSYYKQMRADLFEAKKKFQERASELQMQQETLLSQGKVAESNRVEARSSEIAKEWISEYNNAYAACRDAFDAALISAQSTHPKIAQVAPGIKRKMLVFAKRVFYLLPEFMRNYVIMAYSMRNRLR